MRTTNKQVINKIHAHIFDRYDDDVNELVANLEALKYGDKSVYQSAKDLVEGGDFLCYFHEVNDFLDTLDINDNKKEYTDEQSWNLYLHMLAREISKIYSKQAI